MNTLSIPAQIINGYIVPIRPIPRSTLKKPGVVVTITISEEIDQDVYFSPKNAQAYKKGIADLKDKKNTVSFQDLQKKYGV